MKPRRNAGMPFLIVTLVLCFAGCDPGMATIQTGTPTRAPFGANFTPGACQFLAFGDSITCGFLTVPEDRSQPHGKMIQVAVALFRTTSNTPAPDPIIFLQGGPGGRLIQDLASLLIADFAPDRGVTKFGNHDVILVDQRGAGYSQPSLQCQEVVDLQYHPDQNLTAAQSTAAFDDALNRCHTRLTGQGINLGAYTSLSDAADIHDLIHALGYRQADLYGVSYGTRLALEMMRAYPRDIRSVVLDSTFPPQINLWTTFGPNMAHVFDVLFHGCAGDLACNTRYPHLDSVLNALLAKLNAHPITFTATDQANDQSYTVLFKGIDFANLLFSAFYLTSFIPQIPQLIYEVNQGKYDGLLAEFDGYLNFSDGVSWGMFYSLECAEDIAFMTPATLTAADQSFPAPIRASEDVEQQAAFGECRRWGVMPAATGEKAPVVSAIPTLVLEGEYDPVTPPSQGDLAAQTLKNSFTFTFPAMGHGVFIHNFTPCASQIFQAFVDHPQRKPDGSCTVQLQEPTFT